MTMNISINIQADDDGGFTAHETSVLQALAGTAEARMWPPADRPAPAPAPVKAEPKPRVARKPKPEPTQAAVLEDEPADDDDAESVVDDEVQADEDEAEVEEVKPAPKRRAAAAEPAEKQLVTRDAINAASPLITEGAAGRARVKEALNAVAGAKKVSDLKSHADVAAFLEALGE